jgi:dTMP kinase
MPHNSTRGIFVVLEGIDGSGTTSQGVRLTEAIRDLGEKIVFTNQPSVGPAGSLIRLALARRLVGPSDYHDEHVGRRLSASLDPLTLALLFAADRMDHIATQIEPALNSGRHVVCDRYVLSSLAYQGLSVEPEWIMEINRFAPKPDLTILLDVPVDRARMRMSDTRWVKDLFEEDHQLQQVRAQYLKMSQQFTVGLGRVEVVDSSQEFWRVAKRIWSLVEPLLQENISTAEPGLDLFEERT